MKRERKITIIALLMIFLMSFSRSGVLAEENEKNYERDYLTRIFTSENGLEGTVANCIYSSSDGFLWIGGYTGLYRYDGIEFKGYPINDRALPVNDIVEDQKGNLWIGTNGDGLFVYDGERFTEYELGSQEDGAYIINKLYCDREGILWVGTKAGLFRAEMEQDAEEILSDQVIHDISELSTGELIIVEKTGLLFRIVENTVEELYLEQKGSTEIPRCCSIGRHGCFYLGTNGNTILKLSDQGEVLDRIRGNGLASFNDISELEEGTFWVCSDTGIGILKDDCITKLEFPVDDSIEESCIDYQGNFWFASSRQGVLQIYKNYFSDLGAYWGMKHIVNAIQWYGDKVYVGSDEGLYCYQDKQAIVDPLVKACREERIRQIYKDQEERLWISTYQGGLRCLEKNGEIITLNMNNSALTTNQIRCVWQRKNKEMLVGTEDGLFVISRQGTVQRLVQNEILNTKRILDVKEDSNGIIYVATDGYGVFLIEHEQVKKTYAKQQGMLSGVILKVVPSEQQQGTWIVTGEEICFLDADGVIRRVTEVPAANSLDLLLTEDGQAVILAGNGYFQLKEEDLLKTGEISCLQLNKQDGLPIDFTANSWNTIQNGRLYMCGTAGACSISLKEEKTERPVILYVNKVTEDGKIIIPEEGEYQVSAAAHRLNIDIRPINYVHQNLNSSYFLEGVDQEATIQSQDKKTEVSYTNLKGGRYTYSYAVYDSETQKCLSDLSVTVVKDYALWEEPLIRGLLVLALIAFLFLLLILIIWMKERHLKKKYRMKFLREKEEEIARLAYRDLVTGVFNRNYFEQERKKVEVQKLYALFSVSVNHIEYLKNKYGIRYVEKILQKAAQILQECSTEELKIYRVSENIFFFWTLEPIQLEDYIYQIKKKFEKEGKAESAPLSFSVGAIYNNRVEKENIDELIQRCWKMRILDEKHAEAKFIEGKMKFL